MTNQSSAPGSQGSYESRPVMHAGGVARILSRAVLLISFVTACMIYGVGFMSVLLDARPMVVTSGSMRPAINQGDALIVRPASRESIQVDDIITFQNFGRQNLTTHRVVSIRVVSGQPWYQTKGDNNIAPDQDLTPYGAVFGEVRLVLPRAGYLLGFVGTPSGVLLIISLPLFIMLVQEVLLFGHKGNQSRPEYHQASATPDESAEQS